MKANWCSGIQDILPYLNSVAGRSSTIFVGINFKITVLFHPLIKVIYYSTEFNESESILSLWEHSHLKCFTFGIHLINRYQYIMIYPLSTHHLIMTLKEN